MAENAAALVEDWAEEEMNELGEDKCYTRLSNGNNARRTSGHEKKLLNSPQSKCRAEECPSTQPDNPAPYLRYEQGSHRSQTYTSGSCTN